MGQVCSTPGAVHASTPRDVGAMPQDTHPQETAQENQQEPPAAPSAPVSSAGQLSATCSHDETEHKEKRRSTGEKKVTIKTEDCAIVKTLHAYGEAAGITAVKNLLHEDTPRDDPDAAVLKPYADDASLMSPVLEEALDTDSPAVTAAADSPTAGHHHHHHHVSITEPNLASKPTSMAGSSAEAHSTAGHAAARSNYSIASNLSASEHSFLTDTAVGDAVDLADEVSESVMKPAPSAAVSRMATKTFVEPEGSTVDAEHNRKSSSDHDVPEAQTGAGHISSTDNPAEP